MTTRISQYFVETLRHCPSVDPDEAIKDANGLKWWAEVIHNPPPVRHTGLANEIEAKWLRYANL